MAKIFTILGVASLVVFIAILLAPSYEESVKNIDSEDHDEDEHQQHLGL